MPPPPPAAGLYDSFLSSRARRQWERIGLRRRAGVAAPLFSLHSSAGLGVGEFPDISLLADWCAECGMSVIQLLPLNDMGGDFAPYNAQSSWALDPLYVRLDSLEGVDAGGFRSDLDALRRAFPAGGPRVDYRLKAAKLSLLRKMFRRRAAKDDVRFRKFREHARYWLPDYALYKVLKDLRGGAAWEAWDPPQRDRDPAWLEEAPRRHAEEILFQQWVQWQAHRQLKEARERAAARGVLLMGDLPFLVARDSADVWARRDHFKLSLSSGAPPDMYFAAGQRWGMPPYDWDGVAAGGYAYLAEKLRYAENFYDLFRVDHVIGVFRLYTVPLSEPPETAGANGVFDPPDKSLWEEHGRKILGVILDSTRMLPCGEDLGDVPDCSYKVLKETAVPGLDVQRWARDWATTGAFKLPEGYRPHSAAVLSTHDSPVFAAWWRDEAGTVDEALFRKKCASRGIPFDEVKDKLFDPARSAPGRLRWRPDVRDEGVLLWNLARPENEVRDFVDMYRSTFTERELFWSFAGLPGFPSEDASPELAGAALRRAGESASIFSVQLLQDWLSLDRVLPGDPSDWRINVPGTVVPRNWSYVLPIPLEKLRTLPVNASIRRLNERTGRS